MKWQKLATSYRGEYPTFCHVTQWLLATVENRQLLPRRRTMLLATDGYSPAFQHGKKVEIRHRGESPTLPWNPSDSKTRVFLRGLVPLIRTVWPELYKPLEVKMFNEECVSKKGRFSVADTRVGNKNLTDSEGLQHEGLMPRRRLAIGFRCWRFATMKLGNSPR